MLKNSMSLNCGFSSNVTCRSEIKEVIAKQKRILFLNFENVLKNSGKCVKFTKLLIYNALRRMHSKSMLDLPFLEI